MTNELKKIKKYYGEEMMHLCKKLFPTVLEKEGQLFKILENSFAFSKFLYDDIIVQNKIEEFKNYILSLALKDKNIVKSEKDPFTLMDEAGYVLYECKTSREINEFIKYYKSNERICTFYENRIKDHFVFFAVKKNIQNIKREDFLYPKRDDLYGTSVISIQFSKESVNTLSIKNRYNHTVDNPDATFSNNLDNIIPGLTDSFQRTYNLNIFPEDKTFELEKYCKGENGKLYKYNYEISEVYYCANNVIITADKIHEYEKEKYIIADYFIIDLVHKKIELFDDYIFDDGFVIDKSINKIEVIKTDNGKIVNIFGNEYFITIKLNKLNQIISYKSNLKTINDNFLYYNKTLKTFINNEVDSIGNDFLPYNNVLINLHIPKVRNIGNGFLEQNSSLTSVYLPSLENVGNSFLKNSVFSVIDLPNLKKCQCSFLAYNQLLKSINLPNVREVEHSFLLCNTRISMIDFPNLERVGIGFLKYNTNIDKVNLPKLKIINDGFLETNNKIKRISLPEALKIGNNFLKSNKILIEIVAPNLIYAGDCFLASASSLEEVKLLFDKSNYNLTCIDNSLNREKRLVKTK